MKKLLISSFALSVLLLSSCSNKAKELQEEAQKAMPQLFYDIAKDPSSVKIANSNTVFSNDSLCIIHFNLTAKNGLGIENSTRMEYIFIQSGENKYEAYQALDADSVYQDDKTFEKKRVGTIYERLSYEDALYYRAAIAANNTGRVVGDKAGDEKVEIKMPTGTGFWQLGSYIDEFGDETPNKYLRIGGKGVFSNSATTGSRMTAYLVVDRKDVSFRFIEYDSYLVKNDDTCKMKIKDSDGDVHEVEFYNSRDGQMTTYYDTTIKEILKKGGVITISAEMGNYSKSKYLFKMDVSGYEKAYEFISALNDPKMLEYKKKNENFLKENLKMEGVKALPSGVQYKVIKEGNGRIPDEASLVKVHYEGTLIDGTVFDSSYRRGEPIRCRVNMVIKGWQEIMQHMPVGSIWIAYIPQDLAYADRETPEVPPFSTLVFKIELLGIEE